MTVQKKMLEAIQMAQGIKYIKEVKAADYCAEIANQEKIAFAIETLNELLEPSFMRPIDNIVDKINDLKKLQK